MCFGQPPAQEEEGFVWTQKRLQTTPDPQGKVEPPGPAQAHQPDTAASQKHE